MDKLIKKLSRSFQYGEKGFTLIELLIVIAVLGILAAVAIPNVSSFIRNGKVAAANSELASLKTAELGYAADNGGTLYGATNGDLTAYYAGAIVGTYTFNTSTGTVTNATYAGITWDQANQKFK
jgi:type IV pilus assembly protein PilA